MNVKIFSQEKPFDNPHGVFAAKLFNNNKIEINRLVLKSGESLKPHSTPVDVIFVLLKGKGICHIGTEKKLVSSPALIESPKEIVHYWQNNEKEDLELLVLKMK